MTKLTGRWLGTFSAILPTEPPPVPERPAGEVRKAAPKPRKRVLKPRNPDWQLGDARKPGAAAARD